MERQGEKDTEGRLRQRRVGAWTLDPSLDRKVSKATKGTSWPRQRALTVYILRSVYGSMSVVRCT